MMIISKSQKVKTLQNNLSFELQKSSQESIFLSLLDPDVPVQKLASIERSIKDRNVLFHEIDIQWTAHYASKYLLNHPNQE